eukprot:Skav211143  [mRNA]  locus=scaffold4091:232253:241754:+ [translate_table: standard]
MIETEKSECCGPTSVRRTRSKLALIFAPSLKLRSSQLALLSSGIQWAILAATARGHGEDRAILRGFAAGTCANGDQKGSMAPPTLQDPGERSSSSCSWLRNCRESCIESQTARGTQLGLRGLWDGAICFSAGRCARPFSIVAMIALFLALFLGEIFVVCQVPSNTEQDVVLTIVFALFIFEWVGLTLTDANYLFSFFFLMDFLGTASMVLDSAAGLCSGITCPGSDFTWISVVAACHWFDRVATR